MLHGFIGDRIGVQEFKTCLERLRQCPELLQALEIDENQRPTLNTPVSLLHIQLFDASFATRYSQHTKLWS